MDEFTRFKKNTSQNVVTVNSDRTKLNFDATKQDVRETETLRNSLHENLKRMEAIYGSKVSKHFRRTAVFRCLGL